MCGRYTLLVSPREALAELFATANELDCPPRYNIAPTQPVIAIWEAEGRREARLARWGFVPSWVKDPRQFPLLINARAESMADKPAFRSALRNTRCVVPASGYYEWSAMPDGTKQPFYIFMKDGSPMALAGLYSVWAGPDGEEVDTVTIVTTAASADLATVHHRMPAILDDKEWEDWLDTRQVDSGAARALADPLATGRLDFHPVSTRVNSVRNDDPDLVVRASEAPAEPSRNLIRNKENIPGQLDLF